MYHLAGLLEFLQGGLRLGHSLAGSPVDTLHNIGHSAAAVATKHLDSDDLRSLRDTVVAGGDSTSAMGAVAVAILVYIVLRNGHAPRRTALELHMLVVDTSVDDIDIDALATLRVVDILGESAEAELLAVANARKAL